MVIMKSSSAFWDVTRCSPLKVNRHFGDMPSPFSGLKSKSSKKLV
jgi:hypothetical protein